MFGTIRRHQNWLWIVIIAVIILSFVVFFSPDVNLSGSNANTGGNFGSIAGRPIALDEYRSAFQETRLNHFFRSGGTWPGNEAAAQQNLERDTVFRVFLIHKLKEMDVHVSPDTVARLAKERLGNYPLATFDKEHLQQQGLTLSDFERFMRHEAGIQQLVGVAAASAKMYSPREAEILYRKEHAEVATDLAVFASSNYLQQVTVTPQAVAQYYTNSLARYFIPERTQVAYVEFAASNYLADADKKIAGLTNLNAQIDEYYFKQGTNTFKDTNGVALPEAAAKLKIKEEIRQSYALVEARRKAGEFGSELMDLKSQPDNADKLQKLADAKGLPVKVSEPFDRMSGMELTNLPPEFVQKALSLTREMPIAYSPVVGEEAVYVMALKNKVPRTLQPFETIKEKVTADYKNAQALDAAKAAGNTFQQTLTNGLAQGKTFSELAAASKVKAIALPPFSPSTTTLTNLDEKINLRMIQNLAFDLKPGEASQFVPTMDGGMIVYVRAKLPFDEAKVKAELPDYLGRLRQYRQNEAFNQWFRKQAEQAKLVVPQQESPTPPPGAGAARSAAQ